jgi:(p)ppGpp synthase/HD superfamily hydrolase
VLFPSSYASTARQVLPLSAAAAGQLAACESQLTAALAADAAFGQLAGGVRLLGRTKSLYSIMRKLLRLQDPAAGSRRLGQMYDLLGLRAVVLPRADLPPAEADAAAVAACYRLQEVAQQLWPPLPGRSKDYIAAPKANGYQSLHMTLQLQQQQQHAADGAAGSSSGSSRVNLSFIELQVRTAAMHAGAEGGDAAHSGYKGLLEQQQVRSSGVVTGAGHAAVTW